MRGHPTTAGPDDAADVAAVSAADGPADATVPDGSHARRRGGRRAEAATGRRASARAAGDAGLLEEWLACLPAGPSPELAGRLAARWRVRPALRDACLAAFLPAGPDLARGLLPDAADGRGPASRATGSLSDCLQDPACAAAARAGAPALRRMAALAPAPERADVLAAHAWLSWVSGEGTAAALLAERALDGGPGPGAGGAGPAVPRPRARRALDAAAGPAAASPGGEPAGRPAAARGHRWTARPGGAAGPREHG